MKKNNKNGFWLNSKEKIEEAFVKVGHELNLFFTYRTTIETLETQVSALEHRNKDYFNELNNKKYSINNMIKEKEELILKQDAHLKNRNEIIKRNRETIKKLNLSLKELSDHYEETQKKLEHLINVETKLKNMRKENDSLASQIMKKEEEIKSLEGRIEFLKTNRRAPNKEEILAYEYNRKEVLKKMKNK